MEMMFAFLISGLVAFALVSIAIFSSRSFAAYANYVELNEANRLAMDMITRDLRECMRVTAATTSSLTLEDTDGTLIYYAHNATAKTVTRRKGTADPKVILSGCESLRFRLLQRNPINGTYDVYPSATPATAKVVDVAWNCYREILGVKANTENVQTARIVIRRQAHENKIDPTEKAPTGKHALVTIVITALIGFILATYLTLVQSQNTATVRSQAWNLAMPVVEAGIEDALAHLNANYELGLDRDGWEAAGGTSYTLPEPRAIGDSFYKATITNFIVGNPTNSAPLIDSYGYVALPSAVGPAYATVLAAANQPSTTVAYIGRGVHAQTARDWIFTRGMVANTIDLNGNNIRTDSFDSMDPRYSTNGQYYAPWHKANGDIAVNSSLTNSLNLGNADIWGSVSTGPDGAVSIGPQGIVGDQAWHDAGSIGIQEGKSKDDMNVSFPDAKLPKNFVYGVEPPGGWLTNITSVSSTNTSTTVSIPYPYSVPGPITTTMVNSVVWPIGSPGPIITNWNSKLTLIDYYTYPTFRYPTTNVLTSYTTNAAYYDCLILPPGGDYQIGTLSGSVHIGANTRLYVTTACNITSLQIAPGASFQLYCSAPTADIAGNTAANSDGTADAFSFWGLPACTNVSFSGNSSLTGDHAPNADFYLNGTGNNTTIDFTGASITKSAKLNGHFNFHYDEALRRLGPFRGYVLDSWAECTPISSRGSPPPTRPAA
jgi:hypothetical protein